MTQEETQKQIEAVRGLIKIYNDVISLKKQGGIAFYSNITEDIGGELSDLFRSNIEALTQTLRPYLNGEELEV